MTARHDKATGGRTEAAAVDQAIADVRELGTPEFLSEYADRLDSEGRPVHAQEIRKALAALRVLADAVEELRAEEVKCDHSQWRAAEAERDHWRELTEAREAENVRLARQVADLTKALRDGERIASQYLDTGRGDLDGWVDRARALAARSRDPQEPQT